MGDEERERRRNEEPDVEAHFRKSAKDEGAKEPEDKKDDDAPDVEAHYRKS